MKLKNTIFAEAKEDGITTTPFVATLNKLIDQDLSVTNSFKIFSLIDIIAPKHNNFIKARLKVAKKYGKAIDENSYTLEGASKENMEGFVKDMNELLLQEFETGIEPLDLTAEKITIKPRELIAIKSILLAIPEAKEEEVA